MQVELCRPQQGWSEAVTRWLTPGVTEVNRKCRTTGSWSPHLNSALVCLMQIASDNIMNMVGVSLASWITILTRHEFYSLHLCTVSSAAPWASPTSVQLLVWCCFASSDHYSHCDCFILLNKVPAEQNPICFQRSTCSPHLSWQLSEWVDGLSSKLC